jgi:uncharacterized membrane protein YuzA (DUF378 family)
MKAIDTIATVLVIVGAVNWGLVGLFRVDLVAAVFGLHFGEVSPLSAGIYALVGLAGLYRAFAWGTAQRRGLSAARV